MLWIPIALLAALAQGLRFMLQRKLRMTRLSSGGATFARFIYAVPMVVGVTAIYAGASGQGAVPLAPLFWLYTALGSITQIIATVCLISLFQHRNFTVGITLAKTEVILIAIFGFVLLGDRITQMGLIAITFGVIGVILLTNIPKDPRPIWKRIWTQSTLLGLLAGALFAVCSVMFRGATQQVLTDDVFSRSTIALCSAILIQSSMMLVYLYFREKGQILETVRAWRVAIWVGVLSFIGSVSWFTAFALQNAAYVKAVGQIEIIIAFAISMFVFGEKNTHREFLGIMVLVVSVLALILYG